MPKEVKNNFWVWFGYILILLSFMIPNDEGVYVCCSGVFVLLLGYSIKNQAKKNQLLVIQSPTFQPSQIQVSPPPFVQQQPPPTTPNHDQPRPSRPTKKIEEQQIENQSKSTEG